MQNGKHIKVNNDSMEFTRNKSRWDVKEIFSPNCSTSTVIKIKSYVTIIQTPRWLKTTVRVTWSAPNADWLLATGEFEVVHACFRRWRNIFRVIDVGSEWRTFSNEKASVDPSRVGGPENPLLSGGDLSTMIGPGTGSASFDAFGSELTVKLRSGRD